jgi:hypothetical protein
MRLQRFFARAKAGASTAYRLGAGKGVPEELQGLEPGSLWQPQDGASARMDQDRAVELPIQKINAGSARAPWNEPEDAQLTGTTRSLTRRVMGLNVTAPPVPQGRRPVTGLRGGNPHARVA